MVRVGAPGWKLLARLGLPVHVRVTAHFDAESKSFWADSPDLDGFCVAGDTPEELAREAEAVSQILVELLLGTSRPHGAVVAHPRLVDLERCPA